MTEIDFSSLSVLVVDDDAFQCRVLRTALASMGIGRIREADSAAAALAIASQLGETLHLVITDLDMPVMDGVEYLHRLAQRSPGINVIIVSGKHESILRSTERMAQEYGLRVLGALPKPAICNTLKEMIATCARRQRQPKPEPAAPASVDAIREGLRLSQFEPFFQPIVALDSRQIHGVEALARWRHPEHGLLLPSAFIATAESHGLADELMWVIVEKSAVHVRAWRNLGINIAVSFNVSPATLAEAGFVKRFMGILSKYDVSPQRVVVEVTETVAMTNVAQCLESMTRLRLRGFELSIDDFGTGYSSLEQLSLVPCTELKIDQVLVRGAAARPHLHALLQSSIGMGKKLNLRCVGEGIESADDWRCLLDLGCEMGQGYYIAKPMDNARFIKWAHCWQRHRRGVYTPPAKFGTPLHA